MAEIELLRSFPKSNRNLKARASAKNPDVIAKSKEFGELYFDGPREYGYGGYRYEGAGFRWRGHGRAFRPQAGRPRARHRLRQRFSGQGFHEGLPGIEAFGLDISEYALMHCEPEVVGRLHLGTAQVAVSGQQLRPRSRSTSIHNLERAELHRGAAGDCSAYRGGRAFIQVDSYRTPEQKAMFEELGADREVPRLSGRLAQAVRGSRLYRRLLLDDHRVRQLAPISPYLSDGAVSRQTGRLDMTVDVRANGFDGRRRVGAAGAIVGASSTSRSRSRRSISASAYSCTEIVDCIYHGLMRPASGGNSPDTFLMSKGHGCMIQYVILEELGILSRERSRCLLHAERPARRPSGLRQSRHRGLDRLARPWAVDGGRHGARRARPQDRTARSMPCSATARCRRARPGRP